MVAEYTGRTLEAVDDLTIFEFQALLRDRVIYNLQKTEQGQKYLEKCWLYEQTEPDTNALIKRFGKK